jgi:hypothetical protein
MTRRRSAEYTQEGLRVNAGRPDLRSFRRDPEGCRRAPKGASESRRARQARVQGNRASEPCPRTQERQLVRVAPLARIVRFLPEPRQFLTRPVNGARVPRRTCQARGWIKHTERMVDLQCPTSAREHVRLEVVAAALPSAYNPAPRPERCQSGRLGRSRKPLCVQAYRGFESHPLRHYPVANGLRGSGRAAKGPTTAAFWAVAPAFAGLRSDCSPFGSSSPKVMPPWKRYGTGKPLTGQGHSGFQLGVLQPSASCARETESHAACIGYGPSIRRSGTRS